MMDRYIYICSSLACTSHQIAEIGGHIPQRLECCLVQLILPPPPPSPAPETPGCFDCFCIHDNHKMCTYQGSYSKDLVFTLYVNVMYHVEIVLEIKIKRNNQL